MLWAERRCHGELDAIKGPTGYLPKYEDLKPLFKEALNKDYSEADYNEQFSIRIPELLAKNERIVNVYKNEKDVPDVFFEVMAAQKARLEKLQAEKGDVIAPSALEGCAGCCGCGN
jgi:phosphoenolpyruvate carboxykinase (GTP)